ncbi:unnamed protein product [Ceratitis capitata]|uniref:(Mediterranean fruit fly) hypothetical protein n=1 Tax=Ceratitis capitata TaxID=7213 RepID=A0A811UVE5_CERCA|nr:unnamed protein product [Ceratitis capitata]
MSALTQSREPQMQENPITVSGGKTATPAATAMTTPKIQEEQQPKQQPQQQPQQQQQKQQPHQFHFQYHQPLPQLQQIQSEALPKHLLMHSMPLGAKVQNAVAVGGSGGGGSISYPGVGVLQQAQSAQVRTLEQNPEAYNLTFSLFGVTLRNIPLEDAMLSTICVCLSVVRSTYISTGIYIHMYMCPQTQILLVICKEARKVPAHRQKATLTLSYA